MNLRRAWPLFVLIGVAVAWHYWPRLVGVEVESLPPLAQWGEVLILFALLVTMVALVQWWARLHNKADEQLRSGNLEAAARGFEEAIRAALFTKQTSLSRYGLAIANLQRGDPRGALGPLVAVEKWRLWAPQPAQIATPFHLAHCCALLGELGEARRWLEVGAKRYGPVRNPMATLPEAIVLAREGRFEESKDLLTREWRLVENEGVRTAKHARAVKAFVLQKIGGGESASAIDDLIAGMKPVRPGDFNELMAAWPELRTFLAERQLPVASAA